MDYKKSQIYSWETDSVDERPSEFSLTTGYSLLSGYAPISTLAPAPRTRGHAGFKTLLIVCAVVIGLGVFSLFKLAPLLRT